MEPLCLETQKKFQRNYYYCFCYFIVPAACIRTYWDSICDNYLVYLINPMPFGAPLCISQATFSVPEDIRCKGAPWAFCLLRTQMSPKTGRPSTASCRASTGTPSPSRRTHPQRGIIKPIKVRRPAAVASDGGLGALVSRLSQGLLLGQRPPKVHAWASVSRPRARDPVTLELGREPRKKGQSLGYTQNQTLRQGLRCIQLIWG